MTTDTTIKTIAGQTSVTSDLLARVEGWGQELGKLEVRYGLAGLINWQDQISQQRHTVDAIQTVTKIGRLTHLSTRWCDDLSESLARADRIIGGYEAATATWLALPITPERVAEIAAWSQECAALLRRNSRALSLAEGDADNRSDADTAHEGFTDAEMVVGDCQWLERRLTALDMLLDALQRGIRAGTVTTLSAPWCASVHSELQEAARKLTELEATPTITQAAEQARIADATDELDDCDSVTM